MMSHLITINILKSAPWYNDFRIWLRRELFDCESNAIDLCIRDGCEVASFMIGKESKDIRIDNYGILITEKEFLDFSGSYSNLAILGTLLAALRANHAVEAKYWFGMEARYNGDMEYEELYKTLFAAIEKLQRKYTMEHLFSILFPEREPLDIAREAAIFVNNKAEELESKLREAQHTILELKVELSEKEKMLARRKIAAETEENEEPLNTKFTATPLQTILLFRELGMDFTNGSEFNKTKVKKMLNILTTKSEGNINKKLTAIDDNNKYVKNDLKIVRDLLEDIKN